MRASACDSESDAVLIRDIYRKLVLLVISLHLLRLTAAIFFGDAKKCLTGACDRFAIMIFEF